MGVTTVRLQADVEQHLEAIAGRLHRSKGWVINQALSEYIEKQDRKSTRLNSRMRRGRVGETGLHG